MKNFLIAHGGDVLEFLILVSAATTAAAMSLGISAQVAADITFAGVVLKIAETQFVPKAAKAAAYAALHAPAPPPGA